MSPKTPKMLKFTPKMAKIKSVRSTPKMMTPITSAETIALK